MKNLNKYFTSFLVGTIILTGCVTSGIRVPENTSEFAKTSVMITLENRRSGGSGVVLKSTTGGSYILTNKHICQLIQAGGIVSNDAGQYPVHSYQVYKRHDLCLIKVLANLHINNAVAASPPPLYSNAVIAGHPALLPTMVTRGHFSENLNISLMVGVQECDGKEENEEDQMMCMLFGKKPIVQTLEAQPTTATIMPGSSGSGVFNDKGEITALVFAGAGDLGYGFLVPQSYVRDFLSHLGRYSVQYPDKANKGRDLFASQREIETYCRDNKQKCKGITTTEIYNE